MFKLKKYTIGFIEENGYYIPYLDTWQKDDAAAVRFLHDTADRLGRPRNREGYWVKRQLVNKKQTFYYEHKLDS